MRRKWIASLLVAGCALAPASGAAAETSAYGDARSGSLHLTSGVIVLPRSADMRGVWVDESVPCAANRRLKVRVDIFFTAPGSGAGRHLTRFKTGKVGNCAEGGPNFGFSLRADGNGFACPGGTWKRGRYSFVVRTTYLATGLRATASLNFEQPDPC
jgi:hypothetical protein